MRAPLPALERGLGSVMAKGTRALSGAAKDAYLKRAVGAEPGIDAEARERLTRRLQSDISLVSLRKSGSPAEEAAAPERTLATAACEIPALDGEKAVASRFDPYSPNVVVVIRTRGREAVLAELTGIDDVECLRLLAREQQLGIAPGLESASDIRLAIVAAAERRIANRRAAAS